MNELSFLTYNFSDAEGTLLEGGNASTFYSPLGDEARVHEYSIPVIYTPRLYSVAASDFAALASSNKGAPVRIQANGGLVDMFYLTAITGGHKLDGGRYLFNIEGVNWIGLYTGLVHAGGIYTGSTLGAVLKEITGSLADLNLGDGNRLIIPRYGRVFCISNEVYNAPADGWLPYTLDARENIKTLFQLANVRETRYSGNWVDYRGFPLFSKVDYSAPLSISDYDIYDGDEYEPTESVGKVNVIEHAFYQSGGAPETLYESDTPVTRELVVFDAPYYGLSGDFTIDDSGANYAIVSGTGELTGIQYTHTQRYFSRSLAGSSAVEKTLDNTMVSSVYSTAMLDRMDNYYSNARHIKNAVVIPDGVRAGACLQLTDPLGDLTQGYISEQSVLYSGINKSDQHMVVNWAPIDGTMFTGMDVISQSGVLNVPDGVTLLRLILIQGGKGGWGGYRGQNSYSTSFGGGPTHDGDGGAVGEGGSAGKVYQVDIENPSASYTITVGAGGTGGAINHGEGTEGTHSTATDGVNTYTSENGASVDAGFYNAVDHVVYAKIGNSGVYAGKAGGGEPLTDSETGVTGNTTWVRGNSTSAGNGGGAAYGANGGNAGRSDGSGGDGANAVLDGFNGYAAPIGTYGTGGIGGNGGGGGGGHVNNAGDGGDGSIGGNGANGAVLALYSYGSITPPIPTQNYLFDSDSEPLYDYDFERLLAREN